MQDPLTENRQRPVRREKRDVKLGDWPSNDLWPLLLRSGHVQRKDRADALRRHALLAAPEVPSLAHCPNERRVAILVTDYGAFRYPRGNGDGRNALARPIECKAHLTFRRRRVWWGSRRRRYMVIGAARCIKERIVGGEAFAVDAKSIWPQRPYH
jgi:hypothetical protein